MERYASEKILQSAFRLGPLCYVYYFCRELPDFLRGERVVLLADCAERALLLRHAIAYGAQVLQEEQGEDATTHVGGSSRVGTAVVSPLWLAECFRQQKLVDKGPFLLS